MEAALQAPRINRPLVFTSDQLTADAYHAEREHVSSSQLVHILQTPGHFKLHMEQSDAKESDLMRLGTAVHCALLEPHLFPTRYVYAPRAYDLRYGVNKVEVEAIRAAHPGRTLISPSEAHTLRVVVDGINAHATAKHLLSAPGQSELSILWRCDLTGLRLKVRLDRYAHIGATGTMVEVKTTDKAGARAFSSRIVDMAYDMRAVMYADAVQKAYGFTPDIVWLVIERETGFVATYRPTARMLARGRRLYERARTALARARRENHWPAYQSGEAIEPIDLPRWAVS